jgi:hypothetical protein
MKGLRRKAAAALFNVTNVSLAHLNGLGEFELMGHLSERQGAILAPIFECMSRIKDAVALKQHNVAHSTVS